MQQRPKTLALVLCLLAVFCAPAVPADEGRESGKETERIARVIDDSIGWFKTKDFDLLFSTMADDPDLFMFQPGSTGTIHGFEQFEEFSVIWRDPDTKYASHEIRDLRIHLSASGDIAWFSAILEDCGEYRGQAGCWEDTRWTGVLERRDGSWVIMQMHFSFAADKVREKLEKQAQE